jgi:hypothetical protein
VEKPGAARRFPGGLDIRHEPGHEDEIERAFADHLIGDMDVAALGIAGLTRGGHGALLPSITTALFCSSL